MLPPRHQVVAAQLREEILAGKRKPGEALPSEAQLCQQWSVSRGPVRQALAKLRAEGLITGSQGKPAVVRQPDTTQTLASFTPFSQWARQSGRSAGSKTLEVSRRRASPEIAAALELSDQSFVVEVVRVRYLDGQATMLERSRFNNDVGKHLFDFDPDSGSITDFLTARGTEFAAMKHVLDAVAADAVDADALAIPGGSPLLRERRTSYDASGSPFEYSDDRYRPDVVTFSIMNSMTDDPRVFNAPPTI
ncbi:GntR family transcriptional regulator [Mycobacterium sp. AMU20-3851]|uniref:GntR family transcriptional regulator n=1 Tax=Mycobacterium sp. AMU20-3851 TaxID=3122055 RepID=UPI003754B97C